MKFTLGENSLLSSLFGMQQKVLELELGINYAKPYIFLMFKSCQQESRRKDLAISVVPSNKMIVSASRVKTATCTVNAVTTAFVARSILVMSM